MQYVTSTWWWWAGTWSNSFCLVNTPNLNFTASSLLWPKQPVRSKTQPCCTTCHDMKFQQYSKCGSSHGTVTELGCVESPNYVSWEATASTAGKTHWFCKQCSQWHKVVKWWAAHSVLAAVNLRSSHCIVLPSFLSYAAGNSWHNPYTVPCAEGLQHHMVLLPLHQSCCIIQAVGLLVWW